MGYGSNAHWITSFLSSLLLQCLQSLSPIRRVSNHECLPTHSSKKGTWPPLMFHRGQQGTSERQGEQWEAGRSNSDGSAVQAEQKIPVYGMSAFCKSLDVAYSPFHTLSAQKSAE
jgi:hypothetical protein